MGKRTGRRYENGDYETIYIYLPNKDIPQPRHREDIRWYDFFEVDEDSIKYDSNGYVNYCVVEKNDVFYIDKSWNANDTANFLSSFISKNIIIGIMKASWMILSREFSGYYDNNGKFYHKGKVHKSELLVRID